MSEKRFPLEQLHADALCENIPSCTAIVIFRGKGGAILKELERLYPQSHSRIYYIEDTLETQMPVVLSVAEKLGIPCIVMNGNESLQTATFLSDRSRVSLVSRGTEDPDPVRELLERTEPAYFVWLGFQRYLTDRTILDTLADKYMETLRLGEFRDDPGSAEPLLREASIHLIDMRCVRHADIPDGNDTTPNGLYAEEICMLARYMGLSRHVRLAVVYGYPDTCKNGSQIARLNAQIIWHLTEGLAISTNEHPQDDPAFFHRKAVQMGEDGQELVFLQSRKSGRWWMEVPNSKQPDAPFYISCSIGEYELACKGEVPLKWLFYYQKSNNFS